MLQFYLCSRQICWPNPLLWRTQSAISSPYYTTCTLLFSHSLCKLRDSRAVIISARLVYRSIYSSSIDSPSISGCDLDRLGGQTPSAPWVWPFLWTPLFLRWCQIYFLWSQLLFSIGHFPWAKRRFQPAVSVIWPRQTQAEFAATVLFGSSFMHFYHDFQFLPINRLFQLFTMNSLFSNFRFLPEFSSFPPEFWPFGCSCRFSGLAAK